MVFLPQGTDQILSHPTGPIFRPMVGLVAQSVLEAPEGWRRYRERMGQLLTNVFKVEMITNRLQEVATNIELALARNDSDAANAHKQRVTQLCRRFQQRANSLQHQLFPLGGILGSGNSDRLPLTDWQSQVDLGNATVNREQGPDGKTLLHIKTQEKCAASWRTRLALDAGSYRFEGKARCQDVILAADDSRSGAGLRISRRKFNEKLSGDSEWRTIRHDFEVREDQSEVELVCELRAARGEIWFDLGSLRLLRR